MTQPKQKRIGVFDSGIGGLTVANAIMDLMPAESILYYADTAHLPYGPKPAAIVKDYCFGITRYLLEQDCKLIVVACNTATAAALGALRQQWPEVPFVGMEPAVKPAAQATRSGKVGVLATKGTFESQRYTDLMQRYAEGAAIMEDPCLGLVELIELGQTESPATEDLLRRAIEPMLEQGVDTLVLGCTHYPFVRILIEKIAGPEVSVIDPAPAVARQVKKVLEERGALALDGTPRHHFVVSGDDHSLRRMLDRLFAEMPVIELVSLGK